MRLRDSNYQALILHTETVCVYLCQAGSEENALEHFSHFSEELVTVRSLQYVHLVDDSLYLHWHNEVCIVYRLRRGGGGGGREGEGERGVRGRKRGVRDGEREGREG